MKFDAAGPFDFDPYSKERQWRKQFWDGIEIPDNLDGLDFAIGCYVYCLERGERILPWYIGKTIAKNGFKGEIFQDPKVMRYREVTPKPHRHGAKMMLFPLVTAKNWKISWNTSERSKKAIDWLEKELIILALTRNPKLTNVRDTLLVKNVSVRGIMGQQPAGQPTKAARFVRRDLFHLG